MFLFVLMSINFIAAMGITIVTPILGIAGDIFNVDQGYAMWLMTAFMLTYASFMPIIGKISDIHGRKKAFLISAIIFAFGLFISDLSDNFNVVILGRLIQGLGAGGILPISNAMITDMNNEKKAKGLALVNATYGLGVIAGINLGGIIYDSLGWKWMFFFPMLALLLFALLGIRFLDETLKLKKQQKVDYIGSLLFTGSVISFMLMMKNLATFSFTDPNVYIYLILSILFAISFVVRELKISYPAINLHLFKNPAFALYNAIAFLFGLAMFIFTSFLSPYVQTLLGYDISASVYAIDPFAVAMVLFIMFGGFLIKRFGARLSMFAGSLIFAITAFLFAFYTTDAKTFYFFSILLSTGLGISMTPMNYLVIEEGGKDNQGSSAGVVSIMRSLGGIIGPTITGIFLSKVDFSSFFVMDNILYAYNKSFMIGAFAMLIASILSIFEMIIYKRRETV